MNVAETTVRKLAHDFTIFVSDKGALTFKLDNGEIKHAKELRDGKLIFIGTQEIVIKGELREWKYLQLPEKEYAYLREAQEHILAVIAEEREMARLKRENKKEILKRVDRWKKRIRHYRRNKKRYTYAVHDFTIGAQTYRFYERRKDSPVSWDGVLINPAYKIDRKLDGAGGVPIKKGELMFWYYKDEEQGWFNVRELTFNEIICVKIIHSYGMVREGKI